jgi:hypothetical protein
MPSFRVIACDQDLLTIEKRMVQTLLKYEKERNFGASDVKF